MKRKTRNWLIVFVVIGAVFIHDNTSMPFRLKAFKAQFRHLEKHCDINSGALANTEGVTYLFKFANGDTHIMGNGAREIEVVETRPIDFFWGGLFPFFKHFRVHLGFECFDKSTQNFLGSIEWAGIYTSFGLTSKKSSRDNIRSIFFRDFEGLRAAKEQFVDQSNLLQESNTNGWAPRMSKNLLFREGLSVYGLDRQITIKNYKEHVRDSIPFSSIHQAPSEVSHEIIELRPKTGLFTYQQFLNSGELKHDYILTDEIEKEGLTEELSRHQCHPCGGFILEAL